MSTFGCSFFSPTSMALETKQFWITVPADSQAPLGLEDENHPYKIAQTLPGLFEPN